MNWQLAYVLNYTHQKLTENESHEPVVVASFYACTHFCGDFRLFLKNFFKEDFKNSTIPLTSS